MCEQSTRQWRFIYKLWFFFRKRKRIDYKTGKSFSTVHETLCLVWICLPWHSNYSDLQWALNTKLNAQLSTSHKNWFHMREYFFRNLKTFFRTIKKDGQKWFQQIFLCDSLLCHCVCLCVWLRVIVALSLILKAYKAQLTSCLWNQRPSSNQLWFQWIYKAKNVSM